MKLLTRNYHTDILCPLPQCSAGLASRNLWRKPLHAVFLRLKSQFSLCRGWVGSLRTGRFQRPVRQPAQPRLHNWRYGVGFKNLSLESIMTTSAQNPKKPLFSIYSGRTILLVSVPGRLAFHLKRQRLCLTVKFDRIGGVA